MYPVKVLFSMTKTGGPFGLFSFQDFRIMAEEAKSKMLRGSGHILFFRIFVNQEERVF
jgi:hypothetical protein